MITLELKDDMLSYIVGRGMRFVVEYKDLEDRFGVDKLTARAIIDQFVRKGLVSVQFLGGGGLITVSADAHDFVRMGGFKVQEELLKANIEKLGLEIDALSKELEPKFLEKAKNIASLGASILSVVGMIGVNK